MSSVTEHVSNLLKEHSGAPYLFIGSGFSRRYLGLEQWDELLAKFCTGLREYDYYYSSANGDTPKAASLIAKDFHDLWWKDDAYKDSRDTFKGEAKVVSSALKVEISLYLRQISLKGIADEGIQKEILALRNLNVDGVITTNWDFLLEDLFPDYRVFVGQEELLFSNPQAIAEIYKIHGCAGQPSSLILTEEDYKGFDEKNPYLAAKLITIFIEHPIFFIGYSLSDPHIQKLIFSIAKCLGIENLEKFSRNLIFVNRAKGAGSSIQRTIFSSGGYSLNATVIYTDDFCEVYSAIESCKRKIPARILRYCKEQMYDLVKSSDPETKLAVIDFDEIDSAEDVEFVVGVGIAQGYQNQQAEAESEGQKILADHGYKGVAVSDVFDDFLKEKSEFDPKTLLRVAYPIFDKRNNTFIPVFRYIRDAGIKTKEDLTGFEYVAAYNVAKKAQDRGFEAKSYKSQYENRWAGRSTKEIVECNDPEKAVVFILNQPRKDIDMEVLRDFLKRNIDNKFRDPYKTYFRKLCCYFDKMAFGFDL
ncbi:SIR2 family protein [Aminobacter sp. Piv2-1]|uniref:SIR2 family protein n=1 Tax=Aminobacter sp. Piv2-1 TaxID=3031122 RepID=UPI0030B2D86B